MERWLRDTATAGLGMVGLGIFFLYQARTIDTDPDDPFGPMLVPSVIAFLVIGFGALQVVVGFFQKNPETAAHQPARPVRLAIVMALGIVYMLLFQWIGYLFATLVALGAALLIFGNRIGPRFFATAVIGAIIYHIAFIELMGVHDPGALFEFSALLNG